MWEKGERYTREAEEGFSIGEHQLVESHRICAALGLSPLLVRPKDILTGTGLNRFVADNAVLINLARDLFKDFQRRIAGKSCVFIVTDEKARILDTFSSPVIVEHCRQRGIHTGTSLREESCGTNAVALALRYRQPTVVRGDQHFCRLFHSWVCVAGTVSGPDGEPVACVDISADAGAEAGLFLPMVSLMSSAMEYLLLEARTTSRPVALTNPLQCLSNPDPNHELTRREKVVARLRAHGHTEGEIADHLNISVNTVKSHLKRIYRKLGVTSRSELQKRFGGTTPNVN